MTFFYVPMTGSQVPIDTMTAWNCMNNRSVSNLFYNNINEIIATNYDRWYTWCYKVELTNQQIQLLKRNRAYLSFKPFEIISRINLATLVEEFNPFYHEQIEERSYCFR